MGNSSRIVISPTRNRRCEKFKKSVVRKCSLLDASGIRAYFVRRVPARFDVSRYWIFSPGGVFYRKMERGGRVDQPFPEQLPFIVFFPRGFLTKNASVRRFPNIIFSPGGGFLRKTQGVWNTRSKRLPRRRQNIKKKFCIRV